jgi:hypothetical protein
MDCETATQAYRDAKQKDQSHIHVHVRLLGGVALRDTALVATPVADELADELGCGPIVMAADDLRLAVLIVDLQAGESG